MIAAQQMGFADAGVFDPITGTQARPLSTLFEMIFALLFLAAGGHRILLMIMDRSFVVFPLGEGVDMGGLAAGIVKAGSQMLLFALKLAAPVLVAFLIIAVLLCILARVLPEMNILLASFPLRVGCGLLMAAAIIPTFDIFTVELARWMSRRLIG